MTILLIEDDHRLAELIQFKLSDHEVLIAASLAAAHALLATIRPVLVLVDLNLGDSRGLDTLIALKDCTVPKVVISACAKELTPEMAALGVVDYVKKVSQIDDIVSRIRFNLGKLQSRRRFDPAVFSQIQAALTMSRELAPA